MTQPLVRFQLAELQLAEILRVLKRLSDFGIFCLLVLARPWGELKLKAKDASLVFLPNVSPMWGAAQC